MGKGPTAQTSCGARQQARPGAAPAPGWEGAPHSAGPTQPSCTSTISSHLASRGVRRRRRLGPEKASSLKTPSWLSPPSHQPSMNRSTSRRGRWPRWLWLLQLVLLGAVLVGASGAPGGLQQIVVDEVAGGVVRCLSEVFASGAGSAGGPSPPRVERGGRMEGDVIRVATVNVSSWGTLRRLAGDLRASFDLVAVQELKLSDAGEVANAKRLLAAQGWRCLIEPGLRGPSCGAAAGVTMLLAAWSCLAAGVCGPRSSCPVPLPAMGRFRLRGGLCQGRCGHERRQR